MAWTAPRTWVTSENPSAATMTAHIKDNMDETAPAAISNVPRLIFADAANSVKERKPAADYVATAESRSSGTYGDLTTVGPAVTGTTGTGAIVFIQAKISSATAGNFGLMSVGVTGATTDAAAAGIAAAYESPTDTNACTVMYPITYGLGGLKGALTAGSNTFTAKYASSGTSTFEFRHLAVIPL